MKKSHKNTIPCVVQLDLTAGLFISMLLKLALEVFVLSQLEVAYVAQASITDFPGKPCRRFPLYH